MLRISWQTLRARRGTLAGAFVAIWLAVTLAYGTGLLMAGALGPPGPGRFASTAFVVRADPSVATADGESEDANPGPRLDASLVRRFPGAVGDIAFAVGAWSAGTPLGDDPLHAHGWSSAALTPYALTSGRAPSGAHDVVVDDRLRAGAQIRVATPAGEATYRVAGRVHGPAGPPALFFADRTAARLSGAPGSVNAIATLAATTAGVPPDAAASRARVDAAFPATRAPRVAAATHPGAPSVAAATRARAPHA